MTPTSLSRALKFTVAALALGALTAPAALAAPAITTKTEAIAPSSAIKVVDNNRRDRVRPDRPNRDRPSVERRRDDRRVDRRREERRTDRRERLRREISRDVRRDVRRDLRRLDRRTSRTHYRPYRHRPHTRRHNPYRSNVGISFSFGNGGYSPYRWASSDHSFYRPGRVSFIGYQGATRCKRVIRDGWHHGRPAPISVRECYNPYDGYYIIQGSERLVHRGVRHVGW